MAQYSRLQMPWRLFGWTSAVTILVVLEVLWSLGIGAAALTLLLIAVEVAFSLDNAILNAKVLQILSPFWRRMFLSIGVLIAVLGTRLLFPLLIVAISAHLSVGTTWEIALHQPLRYSHELIHSHTAIAAFGGSFLMVLALYFFLFDSHERLWLERIEWRLQRLGNIWLPTVISLMIVAGLSLLAGRMNRNSMQLLLSGCLGIGTYLAVHGIAAFLDRRQGGVVYRRRSVSGSPALWLFLYLELLDASFSFDGVVGAFAITNNLLLIAVGLGVGALWVRSLTVHMVQRGTLARYIYLEHGAHYTITVVAIVLLISIFISVPSIIVGLLGLGIITSSFVASRQALLEEV
ncbi:MAG TPA: DUF475 domain-containing protein [Candidatus Saccharimonadales bacterium]|nr:DUF475 domain-containing protein [Candidatus Saccharimonadales bacterium]